MNKTFFLISLLSGFLINTVTTNAQDKTTPLDEYIDGAETILIGKCTKVGPINILLRANVELEILLVVKGKSTLKEITVDSQYGMEVGKRYLVRLPKVKEVGRHRADTRESVIPVSEHESIEKLKTLSPQIVVLRSINLRISELESEMLRITHELDALKVVKKGN